MNTIHDIMLELSKKYKSASAAEIIRDAILFGDISGEIIQSEFAEALGISRIPVREALIILEYHGLIEKLPNQHVKIISFDEKAVRDIFIDMSLLELAALKNLSAEKLRGLLSLGQMDFHRELYENTNSPLRKRFLRIITEAYLAFVIDNSDSVKITEAFEKVRGSLGNFSALKAGYTVYAEALTSELLRIREDSRRKDNAKS